MRKQSTIVSVIAAGLLLTATAHADPYNPAERAIGGGLIGAGSGAVIGAIAGGGVPALVRRSEGGSAWLPVRLRHHRPLTAGITGASPITPIERTGVLGGRSPRPFALE
jgi:hypothetical protein